MDPSQMQQVFVNLIVNGAEAIGETGPGVVVVRTSLQGNSIRIDVSDTGCGMDSETQRRIFDPFFTTKVLGRGLGLAAVQGIIRSLNGQITVDSSLGQGTRIQIMVPIARTLAPHPEAPGTTATGSAGAAGAVLVVDDEEAIRKMTAAFLTRQGIPVFEASTGQEAADCLSTHGQEIRAVLLDMTMPELRGIEALLTKRPGIRVVVSSGYGDTEVKQHFSAVEVHSFLPKPYTREELLAHILPALECEPPG
jgi:CheY-like chemotaxis protein